MDAWNSPFAGRAHEVAFHTISRLHENSEKPYSNYISIIQSSGSGKSRLVREMSALVFVIPINVRAPWEASQGAYPPSDEGLRRLFLAEGIKDGDLEAYYPALFNHIFRFVAYTLCEEGLLEGPPSILPLRWKNWLEEPLVDLIDPTTDKLYGFAQVCHSFPVPVTSY